MWASYDALKIIKGKNLEEMMLHKLDLKSSSFCILHPSQLIPLGPSLTSLPSLSVTNDTLANKCV